MKKELLALMGGLLLLAPSLRAERSAESQAAEQSARFDNNGADPETQAPAVPALPDPTGAFTAPATQARRRIKRSIATARPRRFDGQRGSAHAIGAGILGALTLFVGAGIVGGPVGLVLTALGFLYGAAMILTGLATREDN